MWQNLFANLAVTAISLIVWTTLGDRISRMGQTTGKILFGLALAAGAVGSMTMAYEVVPGVYLDLRGPLIAISGFFGGLPAALITAGAALVYRAALGGSVGTAALGIMLAFFIGIAGHLIQRRRGVGHAEIFALGGATTLVSLAAPFTLPAAARDIVLDNLAAPIIIVFIATVVLGRLLLAEENRRALARQNRLYRSMVDNLPDCLNIKDTEGKFLAANPATANLMGATNAADLIGKTDFDFYPAELAQAFAEDERLVLQRGTPETIEQPGQLPDGTPGWLSTLKAPVCDDHGKIIGLVTHNRDITARKALHVKLEQTQTYLDQALANMNDGLAMYDADGIVLFCNNRYRELFPQTAQLRVAGSRFEDILRASIDAGEEILPAGMTRNAYVEGKLAGLKNDGEILLTLADGRTFSSRTKKLDGGSTLRMMSDITERRNFEKHLEHQALHDVLTGLPNRAYFNRELARRLAVAQADKSELIVMLLDLDRFKSVNDTFGHAVGDALLVEISRRLESVMRSGDFVARLGGDEFAILMNATSIGVGDVAMATRVMKALARPMQIGDISLLPGSTIGYTLYPKDNSDAEALLMHADRALYQAKSRGRGSWKAFDESAQDAPAPTVASG